MQYQNRGLASEALGEVKKTVLLQPPPIHVCTDSTIQSSPCVLFLTPAFLVCSRNQLFNP